jgi:seryl-tRNA synthetase
MTLEHLSPRALVAAIISLLLCAPAARAAEPDPPVVDIKESKRKPLPYQPQFSADDEAPLTDEQQKSAAALIEKFASNDEDEQRKAADALKALGEPVLPLLKEARTKAEENADADPESVELAGRIEQLMEEISSTVDQLVVTHPQGIDFSKINFKGNLEFIVDGPPSVEIQTVARFHFKKHLITITRKFDGKTARIFFEVDAPDAEDGRRAMFEAANETELERQHFEMSKIYRKRMAGVAERQEKLRAEIAKALNIP